MLGKGKAETPFREESILLDHVGGQNRAKTMMGRLRPWPVLISFDQREALNSMSSWMRMGLLKCLPGIRAAHPAASLPSEKHTCASCIQGPEP